MSSKEKPFLIAVLAMLVVLWTCFYYVRIGPPVKHPGTASDQSPLDSTSFSRSQLSSLESPSRTHFSQNRHPLAQSSLDDDFSDEQYGKVGESKRLRVDVRSEVLARMNARRQNSQGISEEHSKETLYIPREKDKEQLLVKSVSDKSGDAWSYELDQLIEDLLGEVSDELQKIQNATNKKPDTIDLPVKVLPDEISNDGNSNKSKTNFRILGQALHSFVMFNAYRLSMEEFVVVGLVSVHLRQKHGDPVSSCAWFPKGSAYNLRLESANSLSLENGTIDMFYVNETSGSDYDAVVCKCTFDGPVGANAGGGFLYLNVTSATEGFQLFQALREHPDELLSIQFEGPFRHEYAFCSPPLWGKLHPRHVKEWLMYHHFLWQKKVHYFMYNAGGVDAEIDSIFQPLVAEGLMTVINILDEKRFRSFYNGQHLAINDCLQRARFIANWTFFWDLDEYLQIRPPATLSSILTENEGATWISFGHIIWSKSYCAPEERPGESAVERMTFRLEYPTCGERRRFETCHGSEGLRKFAANPRMVFVGTVHRTLLPEWNGVVFNASIARINHYSGLAAYKEESNCVLIKNLNEVEESAVVDGWWWKDTSMSENSKKAFMFSQSLHIFNLNFSKQSTETLTNELSS